MTTKDPGIWEAAIRQHDRKVYLSVLALGFPPERARDIAQAAWTKLIEQHAEGVLSELEFPGLAIRQARFLGLNELRRSQTEKRVLAAVPDAPAADLERQIDSRAQIHRVLAALATCPPGARKVFRLIYANGVSPAAVAQEMGLSLQRVRQILCETRAQIRRTLGQESLP